MGTFWEATKLMLLVYGLAAVVSFLVACVIQLTYMIIRKRGDGDPASAAVQPQAPAAPAKPAGGA